MKYLIPTLLITLIVFSCKKPLVDTSKNEITDITTTQQMQQSIASGVSMVFFHASWCSKCAEQRKAVETVSELEEFNPIFFGEVEFDDHQDIISAYNIDGFPTIVFYKNGEEQHRMTGENNTVQQISDKIRELQ